MKETATTKENLEERFAAGEDVLGYFDTENPEFPNRELKRVNVDFPVWVISALDDEASRLGISRQDVIKAWVAQRIGERSDRLS